MDYLVTYIIIIPILIFFIIWETLRIFRRSSLKSEYSDTLQQTISALSENERLLNAQNIMLEQKVVQRTVDLQNSYKELQRISQNEARLTEELQKKISVTSYSDNVIIDKSIEFSPEFYQAGLGILQFFGIYVNENYPNEEVKIKIEQSGKKIRLLVENLNGEKKIIEKALEEYQLIITGKEVPETFVHHNDKLILEIKNELRLAKYRIESQLDIINYQKADINKLYGIISVALSNKSITTIDFRPIISSTNLTYLNNDISFTIDSVNQLINSLPESDIRMTLTELEKSLKEIKDETNPDIVKKSDAMVKFRNFIDKISEGNKEIERAIEIAKNGWNLCRDIAGKYNKIAAWCGMPQVPTIFTKS